MATGSKGSIKSGPSSPIVVTVRGRSSGNAVMSASLSRTVGVGFVLVAAELPRSITAVPLIPQAGEDRVNKFGRSSGLESPKVGPGRNRFSQLHDLIGPGGDFRVVEDKVVATVYVAEDMGLSRWADSRVRTSCVRRRSSFRTERATWRTSQIDSTPPSTPTGLSVAVGVDEGDYFVRRRWSSAPKKVPAAWRMSLARWSSLTSLRSLTSSSCSTIVNPG
jgi:hypothetical protein